MPKSSFVKSNMAYQTQKIVAYNDKFFAVRLRTRTPEVPFGSKFIAWTQYLVIKTGENSCKLVCSVEPEYPGGKPMMAGQIRNGMRNGTAKFFKLLGETITNYSAQ